jgi:putative addiction module CopG family antidote
MPDSHALTITLPPHMAALVKAKVASGEYASESDVIHDSLLALQARDEAPGAQDQAYNEALERFLRTEAVKSYDEYLANPEACMPAEDMMDHLRQRYRDRSAKPLDK